MVFELVDTGKAKYNDGPEQLCSDNIAERYGFQSLSSPIFLESDYKI
jgi:hypothetical protein